MDVPTHPTAPAPLGAASLDAFLRVAAVRGERSVARLRLIFCALGLVNMFLLAHAGPKLMAGTPKTWLQTVLLVGACGASVWYLRASRRPTPPRWFLEGSVFADALLAFAVVGVSVWWPSPTYHGFLAMPHAAAFPLALAMAGFRLSRRAVTVGAVANIGASLGLVAYDLLVNPVSAGTPPDDIGMYVVLDGVAVLIAVAIVGRTRRLVMDGAQAALDAERARQRFGVYVSQEVADAAIAADQLETGGERRKVAVLFSDLRGFTRYGSALPPERLVRELNEYLDAMIAEVRAEGGVVDKYIGDAIMVVFGVPTTRPDDAARAIRTALRMHHALDAHNAARAAHGLDPLRQGIGVHFGDVVAGNIGTLDRLQFTVIGDTVNLASRLESATKDLGTPILVSAAAMDAARPYLAPATPLVAGGTLTPRGHAEPLTVYRLAEG